MRTSLSGIVLTSLRYGEQSRVVRIFTKEQGMLAFMVRAERSKKRGSRSALYQPLTIVEVEARVAPNKELHTIQEIRLGESTICVQQDPHKCAQALFVAELVAKCLQEEEENADLYAYLSTSIRLLDALERHSSFHLALLVGLSRFWGIFPQLSDRTAFFDLREGRFSATRPMHSDILHGRASAHLAQLCGMDLAASAATIWRREERNMMVDDLLRYYTIQIAHFNGLLSHKVLQETFD